MKLYINVIVAWFALNALLTFGQAWAEKPEVRQLITQGIVAAAFAVWGAIVNGWFN